MKGDKQKGRSAIKVPWLPTIPRLPTTLISMFQAMPKIRYFA